MSQAPTLNLLPLQVGRREGKFQIHIRVCQYGCGRIEGREGRRERGRGRGVSDPHVKCFPEANRTPQQLGRVGPNSGGRQYPGLDAPGNGNPASNGKIVILTLFRLQAKGTQHAPRAASSLYFCGVLKRI